MKGLAVKSLLARALWPDAATRVIDAISVAGRSLARTDLGRTEDLHGDGGMETLTSMIVDVFRRSVDPACGLRQTGTAGDRQIC
jgi:hypothetical protein